MKSQKSMIYTALLLLALSGCGGGGGAAVPIDDNDITDNDAINDDANDTTDNDATNDDANDGDNRNNTGFPISAQPVSSAVILSFELVRNASAYRVYHSDLAISDSSPSIGSFTQECGSSPCVVTGLNNGEARNFRVQALNGNDPVEISQQIAAVAGAMNDTGDQICIYRDADGTGFPDGAAVCDDLPANTNVYPRELAIGLGFPVALSEGQAVGYDGLRGRDSQNNLIKLGSGQAAFDFTKLDASGSPDVSSSTSHACVRDNVTGLVWSNYMAYARDHDSLESEANGFNVCGFSSGWRLPSKAEAREILNYDNSAAGERIDTDFFTTLVAESEPNQWYWTGSNAPKQMGDRIYVNPSETPNVGTFYPWVINYRTGEFSVLDASCHNSGSTCPTAFIMFVNDSAAQ